MKWVVAIAGLSLLCGSLPGATPEKKTSSTGSQPAAAKKPSATKKPAATKPAQTSKPASRPEAKPVSSTVPRDNAGEDAPGTLKSAGPNASLKPEEIADFALQPVAVQNLLRIGLALTERNLTYTYGSADPKRGGMDCSGTIHYILQTAGLKAAPRDSTGLYLWAREAGTLQRVNPTSLEDPVLDGMRPGDLLFWEGTYNVDRDPPTSHTMLYLGREKASGKPVMVGASDGRTYRGVRRNGVSVFDFRIPRPESPAKFVAYARVPGLANASGVSMATSFGEQSPKKDEPDPAVKQPASGTVKPATKSKPANPKPKSSAAKKPASRTPTKPTKSKKRP